MQPTRQEMLEKIYETILTLSQRELNRPVMIGDVLDWMENEVTQKIDGRHPGQRSLLIIWKTKREPLDKQSDDCISYIFNLLSHE